MNILPFLKHSITLPQKDKFSKKLGRRD